MKCLLILSSLLFTSVGWGKDISWYDLEERNGLYYEKSKNILFTGEITGKEHGKIIKGKREGEWLEYWDNGQLYSRKKYIGGKYICVRHIFTSCIHTYIYIYRRLGG